VTAVAHSEPDVLEVGFAVSDALGGMRLDAALAEQAETSRAQARRWIDAGFVLVDEVAVKPSHRLRVGERIRGRVPAAEPDATLQPESIPLEVHYEDAHLIVVNKPAGMVVHPAPGNARGTLVHALLAHCVTLSGVGGVLRPGIVHRLDKGTSGLLVSAKSDVAHRELARQFHDHTVEREYLAIVRGCPTASEGRIDAPIGRHPQDGKRFTTRPRGRTREARTAWRIRARARDHALVAVRPETGRTHQIRVHLASVGLPIVGDPVYGGGRRHALGLERQALHAAKLGFVHPVTREWIRSEVALPADLASVWRKLSS